MCCVKEDNSYKKFNNEDYYCQSCAPCQPMHPLPMPVILACGKGTTVDIDPDDRDKCHDGGSVRVDTTCLCKPCVKIDYCANIFFRDHVGSTWRNSVKLTFILKSFCNGVEDTLDTFVYRREIDFDCGGELETQDSFCFTYCDCPCSGCCTYKVIVKDDVGGNVQDISIKKTQINAIAQG